MNNMHELPLEDFLHALPVVTLYSANDEHYTLKLVNAEAARMLGYDVQGFLNNQQYTAASVVHPDDLDFLERMDEELAKSGGKLVARYRLIDAKGREVPVMDVSRAHMRDGKCIGFFSVLTDLRAIPALQGPTGRLDGV
ncbi:MAG: PAS domain-containing protein [Planctomycetes bacterium]|nr:PAS domain-containing protein [Planctomycetota bacterium]